MPSSVMTSGDAAGRVPSYTVCPNMVRVACVALCLAVLSMGQLRVAAEDGPPPGDAEPRWMLMTSQDMYDAVLADMSAQGAERIADERAMRALAERFVASEMGMRTTLRNAHHTKLSYSLMSPTDVASSHRLTYHEVEARYDAASGVATHSTSLALRPYDHHGGWPLKSPPTVRSTLANFTVFDGRRLFAAQLPYALARPDGSDGTRWATISGLSGLTDFGVSGRLIREGQPTGFRVALEERDVLLTGDFTEEDHAKYADTVHRSGMLAAANPVIRLLGRGVSTFASYPLRLLNGEFAPAILSFWALDDRLIVVSSRLDIGLPEVSRHVFEAESGLLVEQAACFIDPASHSIGGLVFWIELEDVRTEEGALLRLPVRKIDFDAPPAEIVEMLGATSSDLAAPRAEHIDFIIYHAVNSAALDRPEYYDFHAFAERTGLRFGYHEPRKRGQRPVFDVTSRVYGPDENRLDVFEHWDRRLREAIVSSGIPVPVETLLSYAEIVSRRSPYPPNWAHFRMNEDGTAVRLDADGKEVVEVFE